MPRAAGYRAEARRSATLSTLQAYRATADLRRFLTTVAWSWHIASAALAESLFIRAANDDDDERESNEPQAYIDEGLIKLVGVQSAEEAELYVRLAADLDDGEAMALAIAAQRGWTLATDDRKAKRFASDFGVPVITTPELMQRWAKQARMTPSRTRTLLRSIESRARFSPAEDAPGFNWWATHIGGAS